MKKLLVLSVLALSVVAVSGPQASAWSSVKFGVGANLSFTGGGNRFLWGAYSSAPFPGNPALPPLFPGCAAGNGCANGYGPGYDFGGSSLAVGQEAPAPAGKQPASDPTKVQHAGYQYPWYGQGYQPAAYYPAYNYGYYPAYNYGYYPAYNYGYGW